MTEASLAKPDEGPLALLAPVKIPGTRKGMARHVALDHELRARAKRVGEDFWVILRICDELVSFKYYERLGFETPQDYFTRKVPQLSWRTMRRYLGILEGVRRLPEIQREPAMGALRGIGVGKAALVAPILGKAGEGWEKWVKTAGAMGEEDLRATVKAVLDAQQTTLAGGERAPATKSADQKWLDHTLNAINSFAPEAAVEVKEVFDAGKKALGAANYWSVLFALCAEASVEWRLLAEAVPKIPPAADVEGSPQ